MKFEPLELFGYEWLRYQSKCMIIVTERSPREAWAGRPDLLGITKGRFLIEIEVKRTMSDFRANAKKTHILHRTLLGDKHATMYPRQFYFLVSESIADKALPECPEWAGLLQANCGRVFVSKRAPINRLSRKLSVKECVYMACAQSNLTAQQMRDLYAVGLKQSESGYWSWANCDYHI